MIGAADQNRQLAAIEDYPDWLHPLLVKDLRQNLQSGGFMMVFLWVHVSLALLVGGHALAFANGDSIDTFTGLFWTDMVVIFCVLLPFRELFNGAVEMRSHGILDLVRITTMSAGSIATQRWRCGALLIGILAVSVLPYVLLRYYAGEDLVRDLLGVMVLVVDGLVLLSICILVSGTRGIARAVLITLLFMLWLPFYSYLSCWLFENHSSRGGSIVGWAFVSAIAFMVSLGLAIDVHQNPIPEKS